MFSPRNSSLLSRIIPFIAWLGLVIIVPQVGHAMTILFPLPSHDFDPSESAVPWKILKEGGHRIVFATPEGLPGEADPIMLSGKGLGIWKKLLANDKNGVEAYEEMSRSPEFLNPLSWDDLSFEDFDALVLVGGHAEGMREYLESPLLQDLVSKFFAANRPVGAICHGVLLAARSQRDDGKSVLYEKKTTGLLEMQELLAWKMTKLWMGDYYRTYEQTLESEVRSFLKNQDQFERGPIPIARDTPNSVAAGFALRDGWYVSARWPGDAHRFGHTFVKILAEWGERASQ